MRIAIIGKGRVGTALASGLVRAGHEIKFGHRDPREAVRNAAEWGDAIILAVPFNSIKDVVREIGSAADGKALVDATNSLGPNGELAIGFKTSGAEELQRSLPRASVIKAFNIVFAENLNWGAIGCEQLSALIAGDDSDAKRIVIGLAHDIGFDPIDAGPLRSARFLEPLGMLLIGLGYGLKMGTGIGIKIVKAEH